MSGYDYNARKVMELREFARSANITYADVRKEALLAALKAWDAAHAPEVAAHLAPTKHQERAKRIVAPKAAKTTAKSAVTSNPSRKRKQPASEAPSIQTTKRPKNREPAQAAHPEDEIEVAAFTQVQATSGSFVPANLNKAGEVRESLPATTAGGRRPADIVNLQSARNLKFIPRPGPATNQRPVHVPLHDEHHGDEGAALVSGKHEDRQIMASKQHVPLKQPNIATAEQGKLSMPGSGEQPELLPLPDKPADNVAKRTTTNIGQSGENAMAEVSGKSAMGSGGRSTVQHNTLLDSSGSTEEDAEGATESVPYTHNHMKKYPNATPGAYTDPEVAKAWPAKHHVMVDLYTETESDDENTPIDALGTFERLEQHNSGLKDFAKKAHWNRTYATSVYEDFMYYQNPRHRMNFLKDLEKTPSKSEIALARRLGRIGPIARLTGDPLYNAMIEPYVRGMRLADIGVETQLQGRAIHQELHMRIPGLRRQPVGLGRPRRRPRFPPRDFNLNDEQIEERRRQVDSIEAESPGYLKFRTHAARRKDQLSSNALTKRRRDMDGMRTMTGFFVSAKETPDDWPVSYEYLNVVRNWVRPDVPAGEDEAYPREVGNISRSPQADDDSPDERAEFTQDAKPPAQYSDEDMIVASEWAEATTGRREWHAYHRFSPASTVSSPPRTPNAEVEMETVPDVIRGQFLTSAEREIKHDRQEDHYGILESAWPGAALRAPYHPDSYSHMSEGVVHSVHPLLQEPRNATAQLADGSNHDEEDFDESGADESDDEGDLFRQSYVQGSQFEAGSEGDDRDGFVVSVAAGQLER
ncbi:hypothetical protein BKA63DRAFT_561109 [Paraphoma chrysanthemicola]|nr:hypothetical protein BKA63DRAFT_561109 [Paraphoma chrysanthemicola]